MDTTQILRQHPIHDHPLKLLELTDDAPSALRCNLCDRRISGIEAYTCQEGCEASYYYCYHKVCVEAPLRIDRHPLHPAHPLVLIHHRPGFQCDACGEGFYLGNSSFCCKDCNFDLDIACALSTLSEDCKTLEQITLPLHPHPLTWFYKRHDLVGDGDCYICRGSVEGDGFRCLQRSCEFIIHKGCIRDLYYADGRTKAPRVYHRHLLEIFVEEDTDTGSRKCASCRSEKSGEFIGCETCQVFYHRDCFQVPEILQYPSHNPDHTLVLFLDVDILRYCQSCSMPLKDEIYYRCTLCEFFVHVRCAFKVIAYCDEGMSVKIELSWHVHPLLLCHRTESAGNRCFYCKQKSIGPTYVCETGNCGFLLHKRCMETESTITHNPHHPDHPLTLGEGDYSDSFYVCKACGRATDGGLKFSCKRCLVDLHVKCVSRFPDHKHYLHEHKLLRLETNRYWECNRCKTSKDSPLFRCVPCDFNIHEECWELPQVIKNDKVHWHPLTLHETFVEDDTGEYYCEHCEKTRDPRLGVYVCGYCKISLPRIYHIHCVLPEIEKVYAKKSQATAVEELNERIADKTEEIRAIEEKLKEANEELDELVKKRSYEANKICSDIEKIHILDDEDSENESLSPQREDES